MTIIIAELPSDISNIIIQYAPESVFYNLSKEILLKYDWRKLTKSIFNISKYNIESNIEWLNVYLKLCLRLQHYKHIFMGTYSTILLRENGTLMSCGINMYGQLCRGDTIDRTKLEEVSGISVARIACGLYFTIIMRIDGVLMSCGDNRYGQLGHGHNKDVVSLQEIIGAPKDIVEFACGRFHTITRRADGILMSCGSNEYGQLGHDDSYDRSVLTEIAHAPKNVIQIACENDNTIILCEDGTVMGCGTTVPYCHDSHTKYRVAYFKLICIHDDIIKIACGSYHTILMRANGAVLAYGIFEHHNMLPDGNEFTEICKFNNISKIVCGNSSTFILFSNGTLISCGDNTYGQLGHSADKAVVNYFKLVNKINKVIDVVCNSQSTLIIYGDNKLIGCGSNEYGQLGNGTTNVIVRL